MRETIVIDMNLATVEVDNLARNFGLQYHAARGAKLVRDFRGFDFVSLWDVTATLPGGEKARRSRRRGQELSA